MKAVQEFNKKIFIISILAVIIYVCLFKFPSDDGLRHVGLAFENLTSWGDVYPFSRFEAFKDYNPWYGYDLTLKVIAAGTNLLPVSPLLSRFLLVKILSLLFSLAFFYLVLERSGILEEIKDQDTFTLTYIILLSLLVEPFLRILIIRPFSFGTFFLIYTIGKKGALKGFVSSGILAFFYPYLAWFYTLPAALAHFLKGNKKFSLGIILFTIPFLFLQPHSFRDFQIALFQSGLVRDLIDSKVSELHPTFKSFFFYIYLGGFSLLFPSFSKKAKRFNYQNLLLVIYLLPALKYIRYFIDLTLPLLFVSFGRELLTILLEPYQRFISYWGNTGLRILKKMKLPSVQTGKAASLKPFIAVLYLLVFLLLIGLNHDKFCSLKKFQGDLSVVPPGSLVLTGFTLQYKTLYARPDLRIIPSCEIGFPENSIRREYLEFFNKGKVLTLARKTGAKYLLEKKGMYIDPREGRRLKLLRERDGLKIWKICFRDFPGEEKEKRSR